MVSKKSSRPPASKISSAASPAVSSQTQSVQKSAVIRSAFSPSEFQLALFASVIHGLESQHLRIHDTNTGRLRFDHAIGSKASINSLDWGHFGRKGSDHDEQPHKKKRKRNEQVNGIVPAEEVQDVVVALGTSDSDIQMFSPTENKIVGILRGGHDRGVRDFKFTRQAPCTEGWSIGGDGKLVQWDLRRSRSIRTINLPNSSLSALARAPPSTTRILCASQTPYIVDVGSDAADSVVALSSHRNAIHSLFASTGLSSALPELFLAADTDRYINVFSIGDQRLLGNLIADTAVERAEFLSTSVSSEQMSNDETLKVELLATINEDGLVEIFSQPFQHFLKDRSSTNSTSLKAQRKKMTKKADASLRVIRPDKAGSTVPVFNVSFQGPDLILARAEGGVNLEFERVRWADEDTGDLVLKGMKEIVRGKRSLGAAVMNGVKDVGKSHVDESHAIVGEGGVGDDVPMEDAPDVISLSSGVDSEDGSSSDVEGGESDFGEDANMPEPTSPTAKEVARAVSGEDEETTGEPSFGELLRAQTSDEPIDVAVALSNTQPRALAPSRSTALQIPSGVSLATILTQSLRTNDTNLLESCFHTTDTDIVRATIQRLDPNLCAILLQRLSERLSSRPGRYGHLLVWIQWICVAHGGYMAGNRDVQRKVTSLFRVLDQRCASLDSLLLLKGKLDMLDAQMGLRKRIQETGRGLRSSDDDEGIIYVEGQDESSSSDEEEHDAGKKRGKQATTLTFDVESSDNEDEDMPLTINGVAPESDDEDEESQEGEAELIDDEAEETDNDSDGESIGGESDDSDGDSEEGVDEFDEGMSEDDEGVDDEDIPVAVSTKKQKPTPRKAGASSSFVRG